MGPGPHRIIAISNMRQVISDKCFHRYVTRGNLRNSLAGGHFMQLSHSFTRFMQF
jgi:hypothetical protein